MKVSIITVCKNAASTLERTINSVLNQDYDDIEYIIIDGKSTDETVDIIRKYESKLTYWCSEEDAGIYDAMNKGILHATGDIIGILNSDDWYEPGAIASSVKCLVENDADISYGNMEVMCENGLKKIRIASQIVEPWEAMPWPHPTVFVRKRLYDEHGGYDDSYDIAADYKWLFERWIEGKNFVYLDRVIAHFSATGISSINDKKTLKEAVRVKKEILSLVEDGASDLKDSLSKSIEITYGDDIIFNHPDILEQCLLKMGVLDGINLVGMGNWGRRLLGALERVRPINCIVDNNRQLHGTLVGEKNHIIKSIQALENTNGLTIISVLGKKNTEELQQQLQQFKVYNPVSLTQFRRNIGRIGIDNFYLE